MMGRGETLPEERHLYLLPSAAWHRDVLAGFLWASSDNGSTGSAQVKFQHGNSPLCFPE